MRSWFDKNQPSGIKHGFCTGLLISLFQHIISIVGFVFCQIIFRPQIYCTIYCVFMQLGLFMFCVWFYKNYIWKLTQASWAFRIFKIKTSFVFMATKFRYLSCINVTRTFNVSGLMLQKLSRENDCMQAANWTHLNFTNIKVKVTKSHAFALINSTAKHKPSNPNVIITAWLFFSQLFLCTFIVCKSCIIL